ncbi:MAG TPA: MgtC/SapB family protein [Acidobacteriota bacterium]|nr:MgtC/SapB family protein [Acidobacteriota bacterium]
MTFGFDGAVAIGVAALGGAAIGLERQWSGHAIGPRARIGGIRTFTLLGIAGGVAGWLWTQGAPSLAAAILLGAAALVVAGYAVASRSDPDGTTEVAALVVVAAGALAGTGQIRLASAIVAVSALLLIEKSRLHAAVSRLDDAGVRAGIRFAVMAIVILPLLPEGPYGPWGGIRPRQLWVWVLLFSGISFAGFILRRAVGTRRGDLVAGLVGGLVSSTSVTFGFARASRDHAPRSRSLAYGLLAACVVMMVRIVGATAVLNPSLCVALLPYLAPPFLVTAAATAAGIRGDAAKERPLDGPSNPLELRAALQMALLFQAVLFVVHEVEGAYGGIGLAVTGAVLGLTDMDALTISMARSAETAAAVRAAAFAVAVGILSNTIFKAAVAGVVGRGPLRAIVPGALALSAAASAAALYLVR